LIVAVRHCASTRKHRHGGESNDGTPRFATASLAAPSTDGDQEVHMKGYHGIKRNLLVGTAFAMGAMGWHSAAAAQACRRRQCRLAINPRRKPSRRKSS
jgi:hypothetical protein